MIPASALVNKHEPDVIPQRYHSGILSEETTYLSTISRILLCMDDRRLTQSLYDDLIALGYEVNCTVRRRETYRTLQTWQPELVILRLRDLEAMVSVVNAARIDGAALPILHLVENDELDNDVLNVFPNVVRVCSNSSITDLLPRIHDTLQPRSGLMSTPPAAGASADWRQAIITCNPGMEALLAEARLMAASDASVLIQGDTGTGKELLARAIHNASNRADQAFVAINCAAIPESLLESELFGHCKGAFTGAVRDNKGLFQTAQNGTLFLDEIGEMSIAFQAKLLRVLQERVVRPVGTTAAIPVNVRIISATHTDLEQAIRDGAYREDLYYRLNVMTLHLPSLAQRRDDIPLLANHFLAQVSGIKGRKARKFSPQALQRLSTAMWPGNIRQLCNVVEQIAVLMDTTVISEQQVCKALHVEDVHIPELCTAKHEFEHDYIVRVMRIVSGNVTRAARLAGRNRTEFYKLLDKHGLMPDMFKSPA